MGTALPLAEVALPVWRMLLVLLLAGALASGVLLTLWTTGLQPRLKLGILLVLLMLAVALLAVVWLARRTLPTEYMEAEPSAPEVWLVQGRATPGCNVDHQKERFDGLAS